MECLTYDVKETAKVLGLAEASVRRMKDNGVLRPCRGIPGIRFSRKDVEALAGISGEYSPYRYREMKAENERLKAEVFRLKTGISRLQRVAVEVAGSTLYGGEE